MSIIQRKAMETALKKTKIFLKMHIFCLWRVLAPSSCWLGSSRSSGTPQGYSSCRCMCSRCLPLRSVNALSGTLSCVIRNDEGESALRVKDVRPLSAGSFTRFSAASGCDVQPPEPKAGVSQGLSQALPSCFPGRSGA